LSARAPLLLQRLSAASQGDVDSQSQQTVDVQPGRVDDWTLPARCEEVDCVEDLQTDDASSPWLSPRLPQHAAKRQLDLNIVLSNYIKHRLGKHEDQ